MMNNIVPSISVIIPTYNREAYLGEAIESILKQEYPDIEIIVIDDGSVDNTKKIIHNYPSVKYIYQENSGQAAARNKGISIAKGEYLAFLDSDDLWTANKLKLQIDFIQQHPEIKMLFGFVQQFCMEGHHYLHGKGKDDILPGMVLGTLLIHRNDFLHIGYFETHWHVGEFVDWFNRAKEAGYTYYVLKDILLLRRLHDSNIGLEKKTGTNDFAQIIKESLNRRRKIQNANQDNKVE